ncbi:unnamed protein product [Cylicocyclus nassatus]|uniref:5'-nucleotidase n=1 Tax=Cylicocyclus nassatus TaxID=53992 RepID=A0AA36GIP8_CYLNA|nr:unnamed protein product [Cylicocyclus nassatus]
MAVEEILNHPSVRVRNKSVVEAKLNAILKGGSEQLAVISDFDFTLTKSIDESGEKCLGSHAVINHLLLSLHPELTDQVNAVNSKYVAIEYDPHLSKEEKIPHMIEWWTKAHENYINFGIHRDDIERIVENTNIKLRDGAGAMLKHLEAASIPMLLFSAGVGNVIEAFLRHQLGSIPKNIHIISNILYFNENGFVRACSEPLIHVFCKDSTVIPHDAPFFDDIAHRGNVLLLGDSLGDLHMDVGVKHSGTVLRIGYLNSNAERLLELYLDGFDIVLVEDQTTDVPDLILKALI